MGNNGDPRTPHYVDQMHYQQQQRPSNSNSGNPQAQRQRSGLMPTDGRDSYKRSSTRASERSRAERISYLMATGHLDPEETERLNKPSANEGLVSTAPDYQHSISSPSRFRSSLASSSLDNNDEQLNDSSDRVSSQPKGLKVNTKRSCFEQSYLDELNRTLANSPIASNNLLQPHHHQNQNHGDHLEQQENIFGSSLTKKKSGNNLGNKKSKRAGNNSRSGFIQHSNSHQESNSNSRPSFRQTYTEVTLPMKTSPAFEYILKDNRRRNKRCCLWFLYSTLVTICLAIIAFSSVHLLLRASRSN